MEPFFYKIPLLMSELQHLPHADPKKSGQCHMPLKGRVKS